MIVDTPVEARDMYILDFDICFHYALTEFNYLCGKEINQNPIGPRKKYCSMDCKRQWEKIHRRKHTFICEYCGIEGIELSDIATAYIKARGADRMASTYSRTRSKSVELLARVFLIM